MEPVRFDRRSVLACPWHQIKSHAQLSRWLFLCKHAARNVIQTARRDRRVVVERDDAIESTMKAIADDEAAGVGGGMSQRQAYQSSPYAITRGDAPQRLRPEAHRGIRLLDKQPEADERLRKHVVGQHLQLGVAVERPVT